MNEISKVNRRDFLRAGVLVSGGLLLGVCLSSPSQGGQARAAASGPSTLNAFIHIGTDGVVTLINNKSEMGQGVYTSLPMLVAEELECDWASIRVEAAPVDPVYNHTMFGMQMTGGSTSIATEWERMRKMGAAAREMLLAAAADTWKVDKAGCHAERGTVVHSSGQKLSYGQLAEKAATMPVPQDVPLKDPSTFTIIGKPRGRLDTPEKINGTAVFGIDVKVPGALTAMIVRCPVFGGKLKSFDAVKAKAVPGVREVVPIEAGVAVIADGFWAARKGRAALDVTWDEGALAGLGSAGIREQFASLAKTPGAVARKEGEPEKVLATAAKQVSAEYEVPYLAHAMMEPLNCVVDLRPDSCEIWTGTQFQTVDRNAAAAVAGLRPEQVKIHTTFLGGGFGRRANPHSDFVTQAVQVARAIKKPVKVIWTRADDMKAGYYRPAFYDRMTAGIAADGSVIAWRHTIVGQSIMKGTAFESALMKEGIDVTSVEGAATTPYEVPNLAVDLHSPDLGVPVQWWRSVGHSHTAFVVESFMDEVAHASGQDPYELRRKLLASHPRTRAVLELAAAKAGWGTPVPAGRARGIAVHESFGSYVAQVAEVSVSPAGEVRVHKVVCAVDCGRAVNPSTVEAQVESGIVFGLSAALYGAITLKNGRVEQSNFHDYPVLRIDAMPVVDVHIVPSSEAPSGIGEPGVPPIAPAVANALFAATGKRLRQLPFQTKDLV
jgi:isoquinoline 1-oxidoreductase beta subunit